MSNLSPKYDEAIDIDRIIGANVHTLIWRAGETQTAVAELWGMTQGALSLKLRGKRPWFASEIDCAARRYGVSRDALFSPDMRMPDYQFESSTHPNVVPLFAHIRHPHNHSTVS